MREMANQKWSVKKQLWRSMTGWKKAIQTEDIKRLRIHKIETDGKNDMKRYNKASWHLVPNFCFIKNVAGMIEVESHYL